MTLPSYTDQQEKIINYLYQYRYLIVKQFMKLLNHKDPRRIYEWLDDLVKNKYLAEIKNDEISSSRVYCLDTMSGHILKKDEDIDKQVLGRLYKEKRNEAPFIKEQIFICDIYLHFLAKKTKKQKLNFFTSQELRGHKDFPQPLPSAYIEVIEGKETERYFLEYFDEYTIHKVVRNRVQYYLDYCQGGDWQSNTDDPFPMIIFVLPTTKFKNHIQYYSKAVFEKNLSEDIDLYLITKQDIITGKINWEEAKQ